MPRSYHLLDYDWTPLNRNPCWQSNVVYHFHYDVSLMKFSLLHNPAKTNLHCSISIVPMEMINHLQTIFLNPSFVSAESGLCVTIHWDLACVFLICHNHQLIQGLLLTRQILKSLHLINAARFINTGLLKSRQHLYNLCDRIDWNQWNLLIQGFEKNLCDCIWIMRYNPLIQGL